MTQTFEPTTSVEGIGSDASRPNREVIAKASASSHSSASTPNRVPPTGEWLLR